MLTIKKSGAKGFVLGTPDGKTFLCLPGSGSRSTHDLDRAGLWTNEDEARRALGRICKPMGLRVMRCTSTTVYEIETA